MTEEAFALMETIKNAYINKDMELIKDSSTEEGYKELSGVIKKFDSVELTFTPTWVEIEDSTISLTVSWKGVWMAYGNRKEERGLAVFILEGRPLRLSKILRANPFRQPE
ncbi:MAG: hypothetical protein AB1610_05495 [Nitrospirota bacterium]